MMRLSVLLRTTAVAALAAACLAVPPARAEDVIKIGFVGPLTGSGASPGSYQKMGFELAIEDINAAGGLLGKKVVGVIRDDETKVQKSINVVNELIFREKVVAIHGPVNSGNALAFINLNQDNKIPLMVPIATATKITQVYQAEPKNYVFRTALLDSAQIELMTAWAAKAKSYKRIAILADSTGYGQFGQQGVIDELKKYNLQPVIIEKFNLGDTDMTSQLTKIKNANADAVCVYTLGPENAHILRSAAKINYKPQFFGPWTWFHFELSEVPVELTNGVVGIVSATPDMNARAADLDKRVRAKYMGDKYYAFTFVAVSYDGVMMLAEAIKRAGSTDGEKIRDALENLTDFASLSKVLKKPFSKTNHDAWTSADMSLATWKNGKTAKVDAGPTARRD